MLVRLLGAMALAAITTKHGVCSLCYRGKQGGESPERFAECVS